MKRLFRFAGPQKNIDCVASWGGRVAAGVGFVLVVILVVAIIGEIASYNLSSCGRHLSGRSNASLQ
jgi:hypothetical protein